MNSKLEVIQNRFLENIGKMSDGFGLNGFVAKLYGILYLRAKPLSLDEMAEALGVSKGNVSINIRVLETWGAVRKVWVKGSRKDFYEADLDIKKVFLNKVKSGLQKRINEVSNMISESNELLSSAKAELSEKEKNVAKGYAERLRKIEELKGLAVNALSLAEKIL